jgi:hypothetical protein
MKVMICEILINGTVFNRISSCKIESSWKNLTDTAEITLPRSLYFANKNLKDIIKVGNTVTISLGYDGELKQEFSGYITSIATDAPIVLKCEDSMWKLKTVSVNKSFKNVKLADLLFAIMPPEYKVNAADIRLGNLVIENSTVSKVLQTLKDDYGIYSYFAGAELVSGQIYLDNTQSVNYGFEKNIVSHDLKYVDENDKKIKITASATIAGKKIKVSVGDSDGDENKLVYSGVSSEAELKKSAEIDLARLKKSGYEGNITSFGVPFVKHGYKANLQSNQYPERDGLYFIEGVITEFGTNGFRRQIKIGGKAK